MFYLIFFSNTQNSIFQGNALKNFSEIAYKRVNAQKKVSIAKRSVQKKTLKIQFGARSIKNDLSAIIALEKKVVMKKKNEVLEADLCFVCHHLRFNEFRE